MIRTAIAIVLLCAAIIWLPLWVQIGLLVVAVIVVPYQLALFIPAAFADALYAPGGISIAHLKYTILTAVLIILYWVIMNKTRIGEMYAVEKK